MMMWCRVDEGRLVEVTDTDPDGRYHPALRWVEIPAVWAGWLATAPGAWGWSESGGVECNDMGFLRQAMGRTLAARRYRAEVAGIEIALTEGRPEPVTLRVDTERDARPNLLGAAVGAMLDPAATAAWKDANGQFVTVTAPEILILAAAALRHVGSCYGREAEIRTAIDAAEDLPALLAAADQIDQGWPS